MNAVDVVRKDFLDVRRAKIVWFVGAVYALLIGLFVYTSREVPEGMAEATRGAADVYYALWNLAFVGAMFLPAVALVAAYLAIAGERESGSIKYLLSTPITRRDVVLGKFVSRTGIVGASVAFGFAVGLALATQWYDSLALASFAAFAGLTALYALAYVAVAVAISAATATRSRAMGGALGFYFLSNVLVVIEGISLLDGLRYVLNELLGLGVGDEPIEFLGMLVSPTQSYFGTLFYVFPEGYMDTPATSEVAWYLQPEVALAVLVAWIVVPLSLGAWRFGRVDIG